MKKKYNIGGWILALLLLTGTQLVGQQDEAKLEEKAVTASRDLTYQANNELVENDFISVNGSLAGIAENLATYHVFYDDANLINTELTRYMRVTREDIRRVANKYLNNENRVMLHYRPMSDKPGENDGE